MSAPRRNPTAVRTPRRHRIVRITAYATVGIVFAGVALGALAGGGL